MAPSFKYKRDIFQLESQARNCTEHWTAETYALSALHLYLVNLEP